MKDDLTEPDDQAQPGEEPWDAIDFAVLLMEGFGAELTRGIESDFSGEESAKEGE